MFSCQKPRRHFTETEVGSLSFWMAAGLRPDKILVIVQQAMVMSVLFVENYCYLDTKSGKTLCWSVVRQQSRGIRAIAQLSHQGKPWGAEDHCFATDSTILDDQLRSQGTLLGRWTVNYFRYDSEWWNLWCNTNINNNKFEYLPVTNFHHFSCYLSNLPRK